MELAEDRVEWWALELALLNLCVLLPESQLISKMDLMEICCGDGRWMELAHVAFHTALTLFLSHACFHAGGRQEQHLVPGCPQPPTFTHG